MAASGKARAARWVRFALASGLTLASAGCGVAPGHSASEAARASSEAGAMQAHDTRRPAATMSTLDEVFHRADLNHDGALSPSESGLSSAQFQALDRNHDGRITLDEWHAEASSDELQQAYPAFLPLVRSLHQQLDVRHVQAVTLPAIQAALSLENNEWVGLRPFPDDALQRAFAQADRNRDGALDPLEFEVFYRSLSTPPPDPSHPKGLFSPIVASLLGTYLSLAGRLACHVALHPGRSHFSDTPATKWHLPYEEVSFQTPDHLTMRGWYIPAARPTTRCVIMLHGRGDNRGTFIRQGQIQWVNPAYNVLAYDLRAHGESDGDAVSYGYHEGDDATSALAYAQSRGNTQLAFYGISLGAATAIRATAIAPAVRAVIDDCSYATVASAFAGFCAFDRVPAAALVGQAAVGYANQALGVDITSTQPVSQVGQLAPRPLLVIQGGSDQYISPDNAQANFDGAGNDPGKLLWTVPGARHAASADQDPAGYRQHLLDFLHASL